MQLGVSSVDELRQILGTDVDGDQRKRTRTRALDSGEDKNKNQEENVLAADEIVYKDSSTFLKVHFIYLRTYRVFLNY